MSEETDRNAPPPARPPAPPSPPLPPEPARKRRARWLPSVVWLIPIVAAVVGITLLVHTITSRGPEITVTFHTAVGLTPGKTAVRYKEVDIGLVKSVRLAPDRSHVAAIIELTKDAESFAVKDTRFWVVRPRFAISGISGLETLLSGAYIGVDAGKSDEHVRDFTGLEAPPVVTSDSSGKQFVLRAADLGSLEIGSPIYYRRLPVGHVVAYQLAPNGRDITLRIFVNKPYDKLVTADTRFWHASGVDLKLDAGGLKLSTQSLVTVLLGGVAFQQPEHSPATEAAAENTQFLLAADQTEAMKEPEELAPTLAVLNFDQSVRGLAPGAPVDFRGVEVGQVRSIGIEYVRATKTFRLPVVVEFYPSRMGFRQRDVRDEQLAHAIVQGLVKRGLRAQLRTGNLLTGQLYVALDFFPKAAPATFDGNATLPELPTTPGTFDELQAQLGDIVAKIDKIPFEQIGQDLRTTMASLNRMMANADKLVNQLNGDVAPQVTAALQDARKTLNAANGTLAADAPLQQDTRRMLQELTRTAASLRALTDYLERHPEALLRGKTEKP
ncbi:mammalian cell entry protein [Cupriavidus sp. USMAA2-4]|uniref:Mammalian cell entry protein n=1 Tax=Cupriavidus malaysiensis TaxID=367825 RepID=A0ABN4TIP8_9BURK|nr:MULTISPECIES: MlaD family protein [Cupriavidus]AOY91590.1 mammalian cell entry protein [Cupriavidus sp. USMAA2-4]AOY98861.1 mammalian cell entry protein [Cupriavidus sp. USMAHM13]AOZ05285.1 mammalian cell entry protein [Cupriavidus malaysiensis]